MEMTLDSRLSWEKYINRLKTKAKKTLNAIRVLAGKKLRGDQKTLKNFIV